MRTRRQESPGGVAQVRKRSRLFDVPTLGNPRRTAVKTVAPVLLSMMLAAPVAAAQQPAPAGDVTFTKDIAPILQSKCQRCHRPDSTGPMPLITYEEARPWAKAMKARTSRGTKSGVMPPWHVEK